MTFIVTQGSNLGYEDNPEIVFSGDFKLALNFLEKRIKQLLETSFSFELIESELESTEIYISINESSGWCSAFYIKQDLTLSKNLMDVMSKLTCFDKKYLV